MQNKVTMQYVDNTNGSKQVIKGGYVWHKLKAVSPRILFLNMYFMCVCYHIEVFCLFTAENEKDNVYMRSTVRMSSFFSVMWMKNFYIQVNGWNKLCF